MRKGLLQFLGFRFSLFLFLTLYADETRGSLVEEPCLSGLLYGRAVFCCCIQNFLRFPGLIFPFFPPFLHHLLLLLLLVFSSFHFVCLRVSFSMDTQGCGEGLVPVGRLGSDKNHDLNN